MSRPRGASCGSQLPLRSRRRYVWCAPDSRRLAALPRSADGVESRMGAVAWGLWPTLRFPSPLIEPDVPISGIRLVWDFLCQGITPNLSSFVIPFFCSTRAAEHSSAPTAYFHRRRAQRRSRTALLQRRRRLVLDGREHGGRLPTSGGWPREDPRGACHWPRSNANHACIRFYSV